MQSFKRIIILAFLMNFAGISVSVNAFGITDLRAEYFENPVGIDQLHPRFFWKLESDVRNTTQSAYQVQVSLDSDFKAANKKVWDTGKVSSDQTIHVSYKGDPLKSATRYYWRVKVWDNNNKVSGWSETAFWETGLLDESDWQAEWIQVPWEEKTDQSSPAPMMRHEFAVKKTVESARAYASARGLYDLQINGAKAGDQLFTPGWTNFNERIQYQTYDVTKLLKKGQNAIGVTLGDGWFRGYIGWGDQRNYYGETLSFIAQVVITYEDGTTESIVTNDEWKASTGPILSSDIYNGEYYDARLEKMGWSQPSFDDRQWQQVETADFDHLELIAPQAPPVKRILTLNPVDILYTPYGDTVLDMGQNMIGYIRMKVEGSEGTKVKLRHAETLDKDGNFYTENLRSADQTNVYVLDGRGTEIYEPAFTFQGFRYVSVYGYPGDISDLSNFTGVVIHSDMAPTGHFDCSHQLVNQLQHNIVWGQKGNFLDVPTDCPQRDERLGWTGDIQVFANTANILMNTAGFLTRWLDDLEVDQFENGAVPHVVPNVLGDNAGGAAGWGDASTIVPWSLYQAYGDKRILEQQYESMKGWVHYMKERAARQGNSLLWTGDYHFGDWLSYATLSRADYPGAYTHTDLIATAFFARSTWLLKVAATVLEKEEDVSRYTKLFNRVKTTFQNEFMTPNGRLSSDTQTAYLLALQFDLVPEAMREKTADYLINDVRRHGHLTTGFLGTPHLNHVLSEFGHNKEAYDLLLREKFPSWLYPVSMGATTIWERWDGIKPDSTFQSKEMNSFNHYAYGAIGKWLFNKCAGINNSRPGYKEILIKPVPGGGLTHARAFQETLYGRVSSAWRYVDDNFVLTIEVPVNTVAEIVLPYARAEDVNVDDGNIPENEDILEFSRKDSAVFVKAGSGKYTFAYSANNFPEYKTDEKPEDAKKRVLFSKETRLADLLADSASREILFAGLPEMMNSAWLSQVMGFSLERGVKILEDKVSVSDRSLKKADLKLKEL